MKIEITGVESLVRNIEQYAENVAKASAKAPQKMCEKGKSVAEHTYAFMEYAGDPIIPVVSVSPTAEGCDLIAEGRGLLFGEFGTGVMTPPHPKQELVLARGTYGKHKGANPPWRYKGQPGNAGIYQKTNSKGETISKTCGTNATPGMYNASQNIRENSKQIFREVLKNG